LKPTNNVSHVQENPFAMKLNSWSFIKKGMICETSRTALTVWWSFKSCIWKKWRSEWFFSWSTAMNIKIVVVWGCGANH